LAAHDYFFNILKALATMKPYQYALTALAAVTCHWASAQTPVVVPAPAATASSAPTASEEPRIIRGNDRMTAPSAAVAPIVGSPSAFNFEETPIADVVRVVLGDILKVNYVLYPPLTGTVTLSTREAVVPDQAVYLLESALQANGLIMARDARGTYHVGRPDAVKGAGAASRQVVPGAVLQPGYGAIIVPLQFIGATEMATILRPLLPPDALARVDTVRNLLVLVGTRSQAEGWLDLVKTFDVDLLKGMSVGVFPLKHATTREVDAALRLMGVGGAPEASPGASATPRPGTGAAGATPAPIASNPLLGALRIMPIERINSVLVVAPRAAQLDEARRWIEKLDRPSDNSAEPQLFVYPVQNGSAQHLANVLNGIFGSGGGASGSTTPGTGVAPRLPPTTLGSPGATSLGGSSFNQGSNANPAGSAQQGTGRSNTPTVNAMVFNQGVRVVADDRNNAILIYGSRSDYNRIEAALKRLDMAPTQVLIEASIVEVTLGDELNYGVQWMFNDNARGGLQGTGVLSGAGGGALGAAQAGFSYTLRNSIGNVRAVLNALAGKSLLNVISSPSLMVLDNHTATITAGTQQPVRTSDTITANGLISSSIQYRDTGVSLSVTPSVNAGDMITMEINQSVTDVGAPDAGSTGQVTFNQRQISSKVAVRSGETLVLGGLIRDINKAGGSGVPGLQDIPLFGALFGTKTKKIDRTELLVVITPRVVRTDQGVREVSQELRERMRSGLIGREANSPTTAAPPRRFEE
jgi:general secretion pathway protein D